MKILHKKIILASKSPRRKQLLEQAGFNNFEVRSMDCDESYPADLEVDKVAGYIARKKAEAAKGLIKEEEILLTSDTIVIQDEIIYGKPKDYDDAVRVLRILSGSMHRVITGVCLMTQEKERVFSSISKVYLAPLTEEEIAYYVSTYEPYDKAGSYAIQEWIGLCKIIKIEGTYTNIMGLPTDRIYEELEDF